MRVLLVDWLGRGGIAQTSMSWRRELIRLGIDCLVVTREGRELRTDRQAPAERRLPGVAARLADHVAVVRCAVRVIEQTRPDLVVVQNYVIPTVEWAVYRAAQRAGTTIATVVHDSRLHSRVAGTGLGLRRALRASDHVMAHSNYVADRLASPAGDVTVLPHPVQLDMVETKGNPLWRSRHGVPLAVHFGVLNRRYKGTRRVCELAVMPSTHPWQFAVMGTGAPAQGARLRSQSGYVPTQDLVATVRAADAVLLPYTYATQSGAVVLAQALGTVCIASAVGGIPEQIADGETGILMAADATAFDWADALGAVAGDREMRGRIGRAAQRAAFANHAAFVEQVTQLVR